MLLSNELQGTILPESYQEWLKVAHNISFVEPEETHKL